MKRLLIVDDENELRNAMIDLIPWEQYGYNVIGAVENGEQAVDLLEQHPIDLLITDLIMPKMDGLQLIQQAKRIQPTLHILILSNYSEFDYVKQALQLGASDYLLKASFSEKEIAPLLTRFNQDTPNLLVSHSAEMQAKLLLTTSAVNSDQHAFFSRFQTKRPLLLVAKVTKQPEKFKQPLKEYFAQLFPNTLIVSVLFQKMYLFFIDTSADSTAIKRVINTNFTCQKQLFFVADFISDSTQLSILLMEKIQPKLDFGFALEDTQLLFVDDSVAFDAIPNFPKQTFKHYFAVDDPIGGIEFLLDHLLHLRHLVLSEMQVKEHFSYLLFALINELEQLNFTSQELALIKLEFLQEMNLAQTKLTMIDGFSTRLRQLIDIFRSREQEANLPFHEISDYLYRNTHRQVTLKELAEQFHYNYSYLSSLFAQVVHMNFTEYLTELRIKRAKDLLDQASLTISEVAEAVGFSDISYFSKVFKKRTGQTPSQYKRGI